MTISIKIPIAKGQADSLKAGDRVLLSGEIYTARDAAHKRMIEALNNGEAPPFPIEGAVIYYTGPTPAKPGNAIGAAGPTTSYRMDPYTPRLLELGLSAMIGKGPRNSQVKEAIAKNRSIYFAAIGGAGALIAKSVKKVELIAYEDLGTEAITKLTVENFPALVAIDSNGNDLYEMEKEND